MQSFSKNFSKRCLFYCSGEKSTFQNEFSPPIKILISVGDIMNVRNEAVQLFKTKYIQFRDCVVDMCKFVANSFIKKSFFRLISFLPNLRYAIIFWYRKTEFQHDGTLIDLKFKCHVKMWQHSIPHAHALHFTFNLKYFNYICTHQYRKYFTSTRRHICLLTYYTSE